jgi:hypothetical protein
MTTRPANVNSPEPNELGRHEEGAQRGHIGEAVAGDAKRLGAADVGLAGAHAVTPIAATADSAGARNALGTLR